jgi:methylenetetrahydrofolate dehydrogenase (NADP+)/methenyltetrahydrofolate cyclohydrolase
MTARLLDGKTLATKIRAEIANTILNRKKEGLRAPGLAVILVGEDPDPASVIYVQRKREACQAVGIHSAYYNPSAASREEDLIMLIHQLNQDPLIDGILLQLPLPASLDSDKILEAIHPSKDVDGFHPYNLGRLAQRRPLFRPCTPYGVITLLDSIQETYKGRHAVIIGASNIVGRPMALELLMAGCTITVCHRFTKNLSEIVNTADILVSATGHPHLVKGAWIKPGATVIDVGIHRLADGSLRGDVEFDEALEKAAWITPVPGGVGPMTIAMLLKNTVFAAKDLGLFSIHDP